MGIKDSPVAPSPGDLFWTVEQASRWLTCPQPVALRVLQKVGRDCSMVARIRARPWIDVPTPHQPWPSERGYTADVLIEVFQHNPDTQNYLP